MPSSEVRRVRERLPEDAPRGVWLAASYALQRPAPISEPYPHIHGITVQGLITPSIDVYFGQTGGSDRAACAACAEERQNRRKGRRRNG